MGKKRKGKEIIRNDIIEYLQKEVYCRCKQPTNKFVIGCYYHIEAVVKNAEIWAGKHGTDKEVVIIAAWLHDIALIGLILKIGNYTYLHMFELQINKEMQANRLPLN